MEITFVNKSKGIQTQPLSEAAGKNNGIEENKAYTITNKLDSAEISNSHSASYEDKRLSMAKSAMLYDVSVASSEVRIAELSKQIEDGTYYVSSADLADAIIG